MIILINHSDTDLTREVHRRIAFLIRRRRLRSDSSATCSGSGSGGGDDAAQCGFGKGEGLLLCEGEQCYPISSKRVLMQNPHSGLIIAPRRGGHHPDPIERAGRQGRSGGEGDFGEHSDYSLRYRGKLSVSP